MTWLCVEPLRLRKTEAEGHLLEQGELARSFTTEEKGCPSLNNCSLSESLSRGETSLDEMRQPSLDSYLVPSLGLYGSCTKGPLPGQQLGPEVWLQLEMGMQEPVTGPELILKGKNYQR